MKNLTNLTRLLKQDYKPLNAFIIFQSEKSQEFYTESYNMDSQGRLINPHPLSQNESSEFSEILDCNADTRQAFLVSEGLMPNNILFLDSKRNGHAVWYTPAMATQLYFKPELKIPEGIAEIPPLVWKANKREMFIWALSKDACPDLNACLYHAPFFNIYVDGRVCMGNVDVDINVDCGLERFMELWQSYFFTSYFSHLLQHVSPVKTNIVQLWQKLVGTGVKFPMKKLTTTGFKLKSVIR